MHYIAEYAKEVFEEDITVGLSKTKSNNYLDVSDYEDELSHNEISKAQYQLKEAIEDVFKRRNIDDYKVYIDWCVHVINKELYNEIILD